MEPAQPMTEAMYYILLALLKPGHGYGMMQRIREISHGRMEMGPGTLYGVHNRMKKEGWITLEEQDARRKTYAITDAGGADLFQLPINAGWKNFLARMTKKIKLSSLEFDTSC